jgi:Ca2+-binding EF-hand superfamily protein
MIRAKAKSVRAELELERLTENDTFDKERYSSFCQRIKGSELEAWVLETFEAIDIDEDGEVSLLDFELLEGKPDGALSKLFTTMTSQKHRISIVEWVQFCADLWHVGGQDLVASTLKSFENLIRMREREEVQELREICRPKTPPDPEVWPRSTPTLDERVLCVFQGMDFDGNGTIEAEELADLIQNDAVTPLILPLLDNDDGDGKVTPEEFRTFFDVWAVMGDQGVETALVTFESLLRVRGGPMQEAYEARKRELLGIELPVKLPTPRSEEPEPMRDLLKRVRGPSLPPRDFVEEAPEPVVRERSDWEAGIVLKPDGTSAPAPALPPLDISREVLKEALGSARALFEETPRTPRSSPRRLYRRDADESMYTPFKARSRPRRAKASLAGAGAALMATATFSSVGGYTCFTYI